MRLFLVTGLLLLSLDAETHPQAGWKVVKDAKNTCQISVPENWTVTENAGSAVFEDPSKGIAVVTHQAGQAMKPLTPNLLKLMNIPKEKMFENSEKRIFYQDKIAHGPNDSNSFSVMVAGKSGTCSSRVVFISVIPEETAKK